MHSVLQWLGKVLPWAFSVLGIAATVYFSMFYFPDYLTDMNQERTKSVNRELIELVQERIYNGLAVDSALLSNMVEGKEMRYNVEYPYTHDQLLLQARDGFSASKYLPIDLRDSLNSTIDSLVAAMRTTSVKTTDSTDSAQTQIVSSKIDILALLSVIAGIIITGLGIIGFFTKLRQERAQEMEQSFDERREELERSVSTGVLYEQLVARVLSDLDIKYEHQPVLEKGFRSDFRLDTNAGAFLVECKHAVDGLIGIGEIDQLKRVSMVSRTHIILVTAGRVTKNALAEINKFNSRHIGEPISVIYGGDGPELEAAFKQFLVDQSPPSDT